MLVLSGPVLVADPPELAVQALENMESTNIDGWSYVVTTARHGKKTVERHDATKPDGSRWQLLLKNDQPPTADEIEEYLGAKRDQAERRKRRGGRDDDDDREISALVDASTIKLLSEDDARATYSFQMKIDDEEDRKFAQHVSCTMVVDKRKPHVERIEMKSNGEIKPATGVKISDFYTLMRFDLDEASGAILPRSITTRIEGRAFLVKSIDEDVRVSFTEYKGPVE